MCAVSYHHAPIASERAHFQYLLSSPNLISSIWGMHLADSLLEFLYLLVCPSSFSTHSKHPLDLKKNLWPSPLPIPFFSPMPFLFPPLFTFFLLLRGKCRAGFPHPVRQKCVSNIFMCVFWMVGVLCVCVCVSEWCKEPFGLVFPEKLWLTPT